MQMSHEPLSSRAVVCRRPNDPKRDIDREARATKHELRQTRCIHYAPISLLTRRQHVNKRDARGVGFAAFGREKAATEWDGSGPNRGLS